MTGGIWKSHLMSEATEELKQPVNFLNYYYY